MLSFEMPFLVETPLNQHLTNLLKTAVVAVSLGIGGFGAAHGALYGGSWDPAYGKPFDTEPEVLGWRGNALFEVPDTCIVAGLVTSASCVGMQLLSAQVVFYDYINGTTIETLGYSSSDLSGFSATFGTDGTLTSLTSDFFAQRNPVSDFANIDLYGFRLQFVDAGVRMYHTVDFDLGKIDVGPIDPSKCYKWVPGFVCGYSGTYSDGTSAPAVVVTFSKVPEPGSLALLFAAAVAGLLLRFTRPIAQSR